MTSSGDSGRSRSARLGSAVRVLPLRAEHLDAVLDLESRTSPAAWTRTIFLTELGQPETRCYLVAEDAGHGVVGFAGMQIMVDEAHVTTITVEPRQRRQGVATRLLVALLRAARARGAHAATLEVRLHNLAARGLYAGFGFRPVGIRPRYYEGKIDALIMWAHDIDAPAYGRMLAAREADLTTTTLTPPELAADGAGARHRREPHAVAPERREPSSGAAPRVSPRRNGEH